MITDSNRRAAALKKGDRGSAHTPEEKIGMLVAEGKLVAATNRGPLKPFKPIPVKGTPVSKLIIEERR